MGETDSLGGQVQRIVVVGTAVADDGAHSIQQ
jgi:hypothetical protein